MSIGLGLVQFLCICLGSAVSLFFWFTLDYFVLVFAFCQV